MGTSKNRDREGGTKSAEGDGALGVVVTSGCSEKVLSLSQAMGLGICGGILGDEDRTMISAEDVMVAIAAVLLQVRHGCDCS